MVSASQQDETIVNICLDLTVHFSAFIFHHCFLCILSCPFLNYLFWYNVCLVGVIPWVLFKEKISERRTIFSTSLFGFETWLSKRSQGFNSFLRALSSLLCCPLAVGDVDVKSNVNLILKIFVETVRDEAEFTACLGKGEDHLHGTWSCLEDQGKVEICWGS